MARRRLISEQRLLRLYRTSLERRSQFLWAFGATFQGVWLGVFDRSMLARVDEGYFKSARQTVDGQPFTYVDEQYNLGGLFAWEQEAVREHFPPPPARVVVTGAGAGREVFGLLGLGYDAVGFEPSPVLCEAGDALLNGQGHPGRLHLSERDVLPEAAGACDAVMVGWGSYMLMPGRARRVAFLRELRAVLPEGGTVLCSFNVQTPQSGYYRLIARVANAIRRVRRAEPVELGDSLIPQFVHYFTERELRGELEEGGFKVAAFAEFPYGWAIGIAHPRATSPTG
jgi:hypothetical protein